MNSEEANAAMMFGIPVIGNSNNTELNFLNNEIFFIKSMSKHIEKYDRNYVYSATLSQDGRSLYNVNISSIEIKKGYEDFLSAKVKENQRNYFKNQVKKLCEIYTTKKEINKVVNRIIDEVKKEK